MREGKEAEGERREGGKEEEEGRGEGKRRGRRAEKELV